MAARLPAGVHLTARDCALLDAVLVRALRDMQLRDGSAPQNLLEAVAPIHRAAVEFRENMQVSPCSGTAEDGNSSVKGSSVVTERLTTQEAAQLTGLTDGYWRRLARRGDVTASRSGRRGEWILDGNSVPAWAADRKDRSREAA
ncbi:helix-turn-helix domain-containing protein [Streptomyces sp. NPDC006668]|uniref:helix-turn-helix domain-containing protein n=1 Tax=Streptomyces sp. NPDC006668 TaxID=3156903 RepID=UPI0033C339BB